MIKRSLAVAPFLLCAAVRWLDSGEPEGRSTLEVGLRDEPAHLATSLLVLLAVLGPGRMRRHPGVTATMCAASVLIDVDHVPLYAPFPIDVAVAEGRPFTHSLSSVAALAGLAAAVRGWRTTLAAAAAGVGLHFLRDIATGPGLPVWWPWERHNRLLPYRWYLRFLVAAAGVGSLRVCRESRPGQTMRSQTMRKRSAKTSTSST